MIEVVLKPNSTERIVIYIAEEERLRIITVGNSGIMNETIKKFPSKWAVYSEIEELLFEKIFREGYRKAVLDEFKQIAGDYANGRATYSELLKALRKENKAYIDMMLELKAIAKN